MPVTLAIPCLKRYDLLVRLVQSAEAGSLKPDKYFVIDNGGKLHDAAAYGLPTVKTEVLRPGRNMGVAAAWNAAIDACGDFTVVSNDDVVMHEHTIAKLVRAAETTSDMFYYPQLSGQNTFCVFLLKRALFDQIGKFDDGFWPAYFEDNDYHRRMKLAKVPEMCVPGVGFDHVGGASLHALDPGEMETHHSRFAANQQRYVRKWGGPPHHETFTVPFNGKP